MQFSLHNKWHLYKKIENVCIVNAEKLIKSGKDIIETNVPFYERISSHTARRSFITIMIKKYPTKLL